MALATTCPQCKTSFKVVPDQLKLRRGLVRCGVCQHVFSGIDFLRYVGESRQVRPAASGAATQLAAEGLQTAFFLPETILATPPVESGAVTSPPAWAPEAASSWTVTEHPVTQARSAGEPAPDESSTGESAACEPTALEAVRPQATESFAAPCGSPDSRALVTAGTDEPDARIAETGFDADWFPATARQESPSPIGLDAEEAAPVCGSDDGLGAGVRIGERAGEGAIPDTGDAAADGTGHAGAAAPEPESWPAAGESDDAIVAWGPGSVEPLDGEREPIESLTATTPDGFAGIDHALLEDERSRARGAASGAVPATLPDEDEGESAIDYFSPARSGIGFVDRHGPLALAAAALLALLLGAQWTIAERSMIAARVPALAPALSAVLAAFGLDVGLPRDLESLTIESFELRASGTPGVLALSALLRNRADYGVQWPSMQLTLTDSGNRVLVRKVLGPDDYLREARGGDGLPPRAEWPVRLALEADDLQPAGYSVVLFYP